MLEGHTMSGCKGIRLLSVIFAIFSSSFVDGADGNDFSDSVIQIEAVYGIGPIKNGIELPFPVNVSQEEKIYFSPSVGICIYSILADGRELEPVGGNRVTSDMEDFILTQSNKFIYQYLVSDIKYFRAMDPDSQLGVVYSIPDNTRRLTIEYGLLSPSKGPGKARSRICFLDWASILDRGTQSSKSK